MQKWPWMAALTVLLPLSGCLPMENFGWPPKRADDAPPPSGEMRTFIASPQLAATPMRAPAAPLKTEARTKPKCKT